MLAGVAPAAFDGDDWIFELKWDGYRCLAYLSSGGIYLDSRNHKPLLPQFPALSALGSALLASEALVDGEIVAMKAGRPDFSLLRTGPKSVLFAAFDLLYLDGRSLLGEPVELRKLALKTALRWGGVAVLSETVECEGKALFSWAKDRKMEGIMAKRKGSVYLPGERTKDWLKIKNLREGTFWVVGYVPSPGRLMGSLVVAEAVAAPVVAGQGAGSGVKSGPEAGDMSGRLRVVGRVSSGLDRGHEGALLEALEPCGPGENLSRPPAGLAGLPPRSELRQIRWVKPFFGVEIDYTEMTPDGHLRHPVFKEVVFPSVTRG